MPRNICEDGGHNGQLLEIDQNLYRSFDNFGFQHNRFQCSIKHLHIARRDKNPRQDGQRNQFKSFERQ